MNKNFWKNKNVLITGIHGFVGSNLCKKLLEYNASVYGIYKVNSTNSLLKIENINGYNSIQYLENNFNMIYDLINDKEIDICFHLASQVEVQKAFLNPYYTFKNNIDITLDLLEVFKKSKFIKSIIITSTDKVYGDVKSEDLPYKELLAPNPKFPYEVSKYICEILSECYINNYNLPIIITRTSNIFGPGQMNFSALIPSIILSALNKGKFEPRSNGLLKRDYFFVNDWVDSLIQLSELNYQGKNKEFLYNFGTGKPINAIEITNKIFEKVENKEIHEHIIKSFKNNKVSLENEIKDQFIDSSKSRNELGINYETSFDEALNKTIEWYSKYIK